MNQLLAFAVVILPLLFGAVIEIMSEEVKKSTKWRISVGAFSVAASGLIWFQMSMASKRAAVARRN